MPGGPACCFKVVKVTGQYVLGQGGGNRSSRGKTTHTAVRQGVLEGYNVLHSMLAY